MGHGGENEKKNEELTDLYRLTADVGRYDRRIKPEKGLINLQKTVLSH